MHIRLLAPALCGAGIVSAQFTSPAGHLTAEGDGSHDYVLFRFDDVTWQQLDATSVGQPASNIQRIAWRRDAVTGLDPTWIARTIAIGVYLADAVLPGAISETYAANYRNPPVNVFASRAVSLPDWTQPAVSTPAPWDFVLPLDQPWTYAGIHPFLWELRVTNNTTAREYGNDFQSIAGWTGATNAGTSNGTGCIATGQTTAMALIASFKNQFVRFRAGFTVTRAPANASTFLFLDSTPANLSLPGLCRSLYALPTVQFALGNSPTGNLREFALDNLQLPASAVGVTLYSQALAIDPGQTGLPLVLSNGRANTFPPAPAIPCPVTRVYGYRVDASSLRAPSVWTGGIVTRFD